MTSTSRTRLPKLLWISALLAGTALWTAQSARRAERRFPPRGRFVEVEGARLHYLEFGAGPPVVLLHGNGTSSDDFVGCGLIEELASEHRVIAFDRPGFGHSERPRDSLWPAERQAMLIAHACRMIGAEDPVVVAHSWGTQVALALAHQPGMTPRGLVLLSGYYFPTRRIDTLLMAIPRLPVIGDAMRYTVSALLARAILPTMLRQMFHPRDVSPAFVDAVPRSMMLRPWQLRASAEASWLMRGNARRLARRYREIALPVEIFGGEDDRIADQHKQAERLHASLPNSALHLLPGEGHMLHYGHAPEIAAAVRRLTQQNAPRVQPETALSAS